MRRLPVYLVLDTSGSMRGERIESVKVGLQAMLSSLRHDPSALESVHLSIITFDRDVKVLVPLTPLEEFILPDLTTPNSGPTHMGEALEVVARQVNAEVIKHNDGRKGDWRPLLFLMTDGSPSDRQKFNEMVPIIKSMNFATIVACAAGAKAKPDALTQIANTVVVLDTMDSASFTGFFKWVSSSVSAGNSSMGVTTEVELPKPPEEIQVVI